MKNWKAHQIIESLKKRNEIAAFARFLEHRISRKSSYVQLLFHFLTSAEIDQKNEQDFWEIMHPAQPYNDQNVRAIRNELVRHLEKFLIQQQLAVQVRNQEFLLLKAFRNRGLKKQADQYYRRYKKKMDVQQFKGGEDYYDLFQLEIERNWQMVQNPADFKGKNNMDAVMQAFDESWLINKLRLSCIRLSDQKRKREEFELFLMPEIEAFLYKNPPARSSGFKYAYWQLYRWFKGDHISLQSVLAELSQHSEKLPTGEWRDYYFLILNTHIHQVNSGAFRDWGKELFELYQWGFEQQMLHHNGYLQSVHYRNVVVIAVRQKWIERAAFFLENWRAALNPNEAEEAYRWCKGYVLYGEKRFDELIRFWETHKAFSVKIREINARFILLQARYERQWQRSLLGEEDEIEKALSRLKRYINNQSELSIGRKRRMKKRFSCLNQLVQCRSKADYLALKEKIQRLQPLDHSDWFLHQIDLHTKGI